jgi:hypothetical protein
MSRGGALLSQLIKSSTHAEPCSVFQDHKSRLCPAATSRPPPPTPRHPTDLVAPAPCTLTSTSLSTPQAFHLIRSGCSGGHMDEDFIKLLYKLSACPHLLHRVTVYSCSTLTPSHTMRGLCRWGAGHAPAGCGMQASCSVITVCLRCLFVSMTV